MNYINGEWINGVGLEFSSINPATGEAVFTGLEATQEVAALAIQAAKESFPNWSRLSFEKRCAFIHQFEEELKKNQSLFEELICQETGKTLWDAKQEIGAMIQKIASSIDAYKERCPEKILSTPTAQLKVHHKPHGVVCVLGPFNFPGHLPNAHIIPALLSGNTVVFKGSEKTPAVSKMLVEFYKSLPKGVLNLVQGGVTTARHILAHPHIDGIFFTGGYSTGLALLEMNKNHPEKILALEMGGNNPLIVTDISNLEAAAYLTIQSAFLSSGQRCTCARRLILPEGREADEFLKVLIHMTQSVQVGPYTSRPEPFMGPVISVEVANRLLNAQATLGAQGGECLVEMRLLKENSALLTPGIMDVSKVSHRSDEEYFGPFLQVIRVPTFDAAIIEANHTAFGLSAALFSRSKEKFQQFYQEIKAGIVNWNCPTTGASAKAPFGGIGKSGNHHPSGYYAADYCSYPVASSISKEIHIPKNLAPGITHFGD